MRVLVLILFLASFAGNLVALILLGPTEPAWLCVPLALLGWYLADASSGLAHFVLDYKPCVPGVGLGEIFRHPGPRSGEPYQTLKGEVMARISPFQRIVFDFKSHHPRPKALGRRSFLRLTLPTLIMGGIPVSLTANVLVLGGWMNPAALIFLMAFLTGGTLAQYHHGILHRERAPAWARLGRRLGLLMTPEQHQIHHDTLDRDFATLNGWSHGLINLTFRLALRRHWVDRSGLEPV